MATEQELVEFIKSEQEQLWDSFDKAIRYAVNSTWSMACDNLLMRIVAAARLVGPTPPGQIQWPLLAGGIYYELLRLAEVPVTELSEEEWADYAKTMRDYGSIDQLKEKYRYTLLAMQKSYNDQKGD